MQHARRPSFFFSRVLRARPEIAHPRHSGHEGSNSMMKWVAINLPTGFNNAAKWVVTNLWKGAFPLEQKERVSPCPCHPPVILCTRARQSTEEGARLLPDRLRAEIIIVVGCQAGRGIRR
jgi:hypothetical protein